MKTKFSVKVAAYVAALFLVASSAFFYLTYGTLDRSVKGLLDENLLSTNKQVLSMIRVAAQTSVTQHLRALSESNLDMVHMYYGQYLAGTISETEAKRRAFENLAAQKIGDTGYNYVISSRGRVIYHPEKAVMGTDLSEYDLIQTQISQKNGMVNYRWKNPSEKTAREKVIYMSYFDKWDWIISTSTYKSEFNKLINIGDFQEEIAGVQIGKSGYISVIDSKGSFILHPFYQGKNMNDMDANSRKVIQRIIAEKNGVFEYQWRNTWDSQERPKKAAFSYVEAYDWYVVSNYYQDEIYGPFQSAMNAFIVIVFIGVFITAALIILLVRRQSKPLASMVEAFSSGAGGDLSVRLDASRKDEFGELSSCFNVFMESLEDMKARLENEVHVRKENEKRMHSLLDTTSEGYVQMTTGGYIMDINETFCQIFRADRASMMGKLINDFFVGEAREIFVHEMAYVRQGTRVKFEMRLANRMSDGSEQAFLVSASPVINAQSAVTGAFALFTDITVLRHALEAKEDALEKYQELNRNLEDRIEERTEELREYIQQLKSTQEALIQAEKLSSLGLMISGIANELNSPLGNGITMSSFLEAQSREILDQAAGHPEHVSLRASEYNDFALNVKAASSMILENLAKASEVLGSLKHIYPEQMKGMKEVFHLSSVIMEAYGVFRKSFKLGAHRLDLVCDENLTLHSYPKLIKQLLMNLMSNSLTHGFKSGYPGTVQIKVFQTEEELRIEYSDDGEGIPDSVKEKIFEPFLKGSGGEGRLGLGLYTVYNIVVLSLRGAIDWNSVPGMGTHFLIRLPISVLKSSEKEHL